MAEKIAIDHADLASIPDLVGCPGVGSQWAVKKMAQVARTRLVTLAQQKLFTSARDYVKGIQPLRQEQGPSGKVRFVVEVKGPLPNLVEHGAESWDLRLTILKPGTRRLKVSKAGYLYVSIPFMHMGPTASGRNAPAMGSQFTEATLREESRAHRGEMNAAQARVLGRAVFREAKKLEASLSAPGGGKVQYGGRLEEGLAPILRPRHAGDIFAGMVREEKTYEKDTQSTYMTFRTISNNPASVREDDGGRNWTHPGITARRLVPQAQEYMQALFDQGHFDV